MSVKIKRINIDHEKAMALHAAGKTDREIADACYVCNSTVINFRRKYGLPCNRVPRKRKDPVQAAKPEKPKKYRSKLAEENAEARRCGLNYGMWKAQQFEKQKKAKIALGKKYVPEEPVKVEEPPKRGNYPTSKPVLCVETGVVYPSIRSAAIALDGYNMNITRAIQKGTIACGYHWKFAP